MPPRARYDSAMQLTFCGAARQVTGSCFLFETGGRRFLVDCGMFQGSREAAALNDAPFQFDPSGIDFVVLTHAHIDHSGLLPRLAAKGFKGPIYATGATRDLAEVMLPDSAYLQETEAERAARYGRELTPSYTMEEARAVLRQFRPVEYDAEFEPVTGVRVRLRDAGHILGSAIVELWLTERGHTVKVVVSGDLGQPGRPIVRDPTPIEEADVLLVESTYGNRNHKRLQPTLEEFVSAVNRTLEEKRGVVLIPAFAVGRTQEVLYYFNRLAREGRFGPLNIFVDSPMAAEVTQITARHLALFDEEAKRLVRQPLPDGTAVRLRFTETVQDSMALNRIESGAVIIAASGMCDGGRIRHHLRQRIANPRTTVLITGFQAAGTLGRRLVDGARTVTLFGDEIPVRAEIITLGGFSAHADQAALLDWLGAFRKPPRQTFLVHGEEDIAEAFASTIRSRLGWQPRIPVHGQTVPLQTSSASRGQDRP